jgi:decaprenyl-phosphate phosphoribosyltransferase
MNLKPYAKIARPDHWVKQIFVLPGIALAYLASKPRIEDVVIPIIVGLMATCLVASANYTINEWLDREFDKYHPKKKKRPSANNLIKGKFVYLQYLTLSAVGIALGALVSLPFLLTLIFLLFMGLVYNVNPIRSKDKPYLDVLSESINNPIRLALGWFIIISVVVPPSTIFIAYWMGGAFLMAIKRYAEYVSINDKDTASLYRKSFKYYTKENLLMSAFFYALVSVFFLGVFMFKYKIELIISFPFISWMYVWYLYFAFSPNSKAQNPEGLYTEHRFLLYVVFLVILIAVLTVVHIPLLEVLTEPVITL